ncbi:MAG: hypothetical protein ACPGTQ_11170 [Colwellia sp.]|uniref:hypothetical protein n=1 Tax=Pseudoalteromonas TaxID=53246 RepID=UPI001582FA27|nr:MULTISPECIES: hypothetical protein [Pseudoalteromonas]MDI4653146.1 hypothetical protein [Pseudoalteromonas shioyasakiensis]NUJ39150.1 hypothetical protein [Pseudoalteromonas sp. 0303]
MKNPLKLRFNVEENTILRFCTAIIFILLLLGVWQFNHHWNKKHTLKIIDVGAAIDADYTISRFDGDTTKVSATGGTFLVAGVFQVIKGNKLILELSSSGRQKLCDTVQNICFNLI